MGDNLIQQVSNLIMNDQDFRMLSQRRDVYCPFEALGAARTEIRHSNFLANLITPNASHGFGEVLLRSFLEALLSETGAAELLLELHLSDLSGSIVMREWKHIDILVRIPRSHSKRPDVVLAVEIKVESGEHGNQLETYEKVVKETWPSANAFFLFLTPDHAASSRDEWVDVPFSTVLDAFEDALKAGEGQPDARRMAELYISMMRRRYVADEQLNELAVQIWSRHRAALEFLIEHQPNAANDLLQAVVGSDLPAQISHEFEKQGSGLTFLLDTNSARHIRLAVAEWDNARGMLSSERWVASNRMVLLEIEVHAGGVHARWVVGRGPQENRKSFIDALDPNRKKKITSDWTRIGTKPILSKKEMEAVIEDGLDEKTVQKVVTGLVKYAVTTGAEFNQALIDAGLM